MKIYFIRNSTLRYHVLLGVFGFLLGFALYCIGFADFGEVHRMFILDDLRMLLSFMGAVMLAAIGFLIVGRGHKIQAKPFHKGIIPGSSLFGLGWAITGACPAIAMAQLGGGSMPAIITALGILAGVWIFRKLQPRYFRWDTGSCDI